MSAACVMDGRAFNRPDGMRWYISVTHHTGVRMDPMRCRWFSSRREAREALQLDARRGA